MPKIQRFFIISIFLFLFSTFANAQAMMSYLYLEVVDSNQKPLSDVKIDCSRCERGIQTIGNKTTLVGYFWMMKLLESRFTITKQDYFPFQDFGELGYSNDKNIKVELLKIPKTKEENKTLGDEQLKREFFSALRNNDVEKVRKLLKAGISPNLTTRDLRGISGIKNIPAIIIPTALGNSEIITLLLEAGVVINKEDVYAPQILFYYFHSSILEGFLYKKLTERSQILKDYDEGLKNLIKAGANVNSTYSDISPLMLAISSNLASSAKILITSGADINAKDKSGRTALMIANAKANEFRNEKDWLEQFQEIIKLLEAAGAK